MRRFWYVLMVPVFLLGRELNRWQVRLHGEMPLTYPWGDWIPFHQYLLSIGDILQIGAWLVVFGFLWWQLGRSGWKQK